MYQELVRIFQLHKKTLLILLLTWGVYFVLLFGRILYFRPDGLYAGHTNVWSDWALHIGMAHIFATKDPSHWFDYHPMYAGGKFTYGFLTNLISGLLMRMGMPLELAFILPSILYILLFLIALYLLSYLLIRSQKGAYLAVSLFLLSSGLGFVDFIKDFAKQPELSSLLYPTVEYSRVDELEWYSGNYVVGMLAPQRAFLLGVTIALWSLVLLLTALRQNPYRNNKMLLVISGLLMGLLPITHMHSLISLSFIVLFTYVLNVRRWRLLVWHAIPAGALALCLYLIFIAGGIENPKFMTWLPGWTNRNGFIGWLRMWTQFWGAMPYICIITLVSLWNRFTAQLKALALGTIAIFGLSNLVLLQPIHWDNSKLFLWAYLGSSVISAYGIVKLWRKQTVFKFLSFIIIILLISTGMLELIRLQRIDKNSYMMISREEIRLMEEIRAKTQPDARFVTAPSHNHPVMMWAARPVLMGYTAWTWNFGFLYQQREKDIKAIYSGTHNTIDLLKKYKVSFIYVGPNEVNDLDPNVSYFYQNFPIAFSSDTVLVFDTRSVVFGK